MLSLISDKLLRSKRSLKCAARVFSLRSLSESIRKNSVEQQLRVMFDRDRELEFKVSDLETRLKSIRAVEGNHVGDSHAIAKKFQANELLKTRQFYAYCAVISENLMAKQKVIVNERALIAKEIEIKLAEWKNCLKRRTNYSERLDQLARIRFRMSEVLENIDLEESLHVDISDRY